MSDSAQHQTTIRTAHFHGKEMPLVSVLYALAGQEGNDGDEGNAMQAAGRAVTRSSDEDRPTVAVLHS